MRGFESNHGIDLPPDYRCFLTTIGNGGAGPFYGLEVLRAFDRDLSKPFPFTAATDSIRADEPGRDVAEFPGLLEVCHQGCGIYSYLVVNGPTYGTIWDGRAEDDDYRPTGLAFNVWYRRWASRALLALENERLVQRLRVGMSEADVLAAVGGHWQKRPAANGQLWYFEAPEIPAQVLLDERGVVTKVSPWPFIVAAPA